MCQFKSGIILENRCYIAQGKINIPKPTLNFNDWKGGDGMKHYITKYSVDGKRFAESWLQINLFGMCFCFSKRKIAL